MSNGKQPRAQSQIQKCPKQRDFFEQQAIANNSFVCGIDEVGRGCLFGPVVTAAVILSEKSWPPFIRDSKELSATKRQQAYAWITQHCWYGIGIQDHTQVDHYNIYNATARAMHQALANLLVHSPHHPSMVLVDAMPLKPTILPAPVISFPKGESWSSSIAAASILAKVVRDTLVTQMCKTFPGFDLQANKGYGTKKHLQALAQRGATIVHRKTFLKGIHAKHSTGQQTIC